MATKHPCDTVEIGGKDAHDDSIVIIFTLSDESPDDLRLDRANAVKLRDILNEAIAELDQ